VLFAAMIVAAGSAVAVRWFDAFAGLYVGAAVVLALLLGWRIDRSRLVFASVVLGLAAWLLHHAAARHDALTRIVPDAVALLLPLNIALLALGKERGTFTAHGLLRWAVIAAQPAAVWALLQLRRYDWLTLFDAQPLPADWLPPLPVEQPALLAFAIAFGTVAYLALRLRNALETGLFWALALVGYGLLLLPSTALTLACFATAIVTLVAAAIEASHTMAFRDELTGLPARRALNQGLLKLGSRYTVAMLDVDHFKKFNDSYGHDVGDEVLRMVAARVAGVKGGGKPFRYGGEEFTVVFPGKSLDEAVPHLERLREAIAGGGFTVRGPDRPRKKGARPVKGGERTVRITISIGVAERQGDQRDPHQVIKAADLALYRAKSAGRNCVAS
jgi:diguanylate cyclase (GGDEF)-like protein